MTAPTVPVVAGEAERRAANRLLFFRNRKTLIGLCILGFFVLIAIVGDFIAPYDPDKTSADVLQSPSAAHWLGTTNTGQDIASQLIVGTRGVLLTGFLAGMLATVLSVIVGVTSGFLGGLGDELLSLVSNIFLVIPALPLVIIVAGQIPSAGGTTVAVVIALTGWAWGSRVLRAQTLSLRRRDFVEASRANGESLWRLVLFEIMPNLTAVIAAGFVGTVVFAILAEIALAFIGVTSISEWNWGTILFWAQSNQALAQGAWWWFVPAGLCIAAVGTALSLINFGIDEFINPRLRTTGQDAKLLRRKRIRARVGFTPVLSGSDGGSSVARRVLTESGKAEPVPTTGRNRDLATTPPDEVSGVAAVGQHPSSEPLQQEES